MIAVVCLSNCIQWWTWLSIEQRSITLNLDNIRHIIIARRTSQSHAMNISGTARM